MLRSIVGVIVGYIVLAVVVMGLFLGLWYALGVENMLQPGEYKAKLPLNVGAVAASLIGAIAGGFVCSSIAPTKTASRVFAAIVLVLGICAAVSTLNKPEPGPRTPGLSVIETIKQGREPNWYAILNPLLGAGGVLIGAALVKKKV